MSWKKNLIVGASVAGAATLTIHLINKLVYFSATLDNLLSNPSGSYYNWKFGNIYYTKSGRRKTCSSDTQSFYFQFRIRMASDKRETCENEYCLLY